MIHQTLKRAELHLAKDMWVDTIRTCNTVLVQDRDHVGALELLAKAQWKGTQNRELLQTLSRLIALNPYEPGYHALKGAAHQALREFESALACYERAADCTDVAGLAAQLQESQQKVIQQLVQEDPVFRVRYSRDPNHACRRAGFTHASGAHATSPIKVAFQQRGESLTRPS